MKIPRISNRELWRFGKLNSVLWLTFKFGLPLGIAILVIGTIFAGLIDPQQFGKRVPPKVSSVAEAVMALACIALSLNCLLEGYVSSQSFPKSVRLVINRVLPYILISVLLGVGAVVLCILAVRDWLK
jgi:hypothetical protein